MVLSDFGDELIVQNSHEKDTGNNGLCLDHGRRHRQWTLNNVNDGEALRQLPSMPGINVPMKYIGGLLTHFCFHTEDKELGSI